MCFISRRRPFPRIGDREKILKFLIFYPGQERSPESQQSNGEKDFCKFQAFTIKNRLQIVCPKRRKFLKAIFNGENFEFSKTVFTIPETLENVPGAGVNTIRNFKKNSQSLIINNVNLTYFCLEKIVLYI